MSGITVTVTETVGNVTVTENETIITTINGIAEAQHLAFSPHGTITATNVQEALEQVADQHFVQEESPTNATEGDLWYDTNDDQLMVYREISTGVFDWRTLAIAGYAPPVGAQAGTYDYTQVDMETLDGGNY
jgi:hypothetical protein